MATFADATAGELADPTLERLVTPANLITLVRTVGAVALAGLAVDAGSRNLLIASLVVYWVGDVLDGTVARLTARETRIGAVLDILSDRLCAASFYLGLAWLEPELTLPVLIYLTEFMLVDAFLSLAFLAWPLRSPNYFYVVDRRLWLWNWSKTGKTANSAVFAVVLLVTGAAWLGVLIASALLVAKSASVVRLLRIGLPIPPVAMPQSSGR
jgi:CDP-diacylglycerol--glycerol-3-phosphate 3-phosphatidyltransferase